MFLLTLEMIRFCVKNLKPCDAVENLAQYIVQWKLNNLFLFAFANKNAIRGNRYSGTCPLMPTSLLLVQ